MAKSAVRILVVDDERPIRRFLNASLGGQYTVLEAATGEEALAMTVSSRPDVIILDLGLPDMDGVEVTRRLREWTQIPIIVVSVRDQESDCRFSHAVYFPAIKYLRRRTPGPTVGQSA
jgi:two-component system KDP operon response regulator KdpE